VFELRASGWGINGDKYSASGEYIYLKATISSDGVLIGCVTTSQKETEGVGSVCQTQGFYDKYTDRDKDGVSEVDASTGATVTSSGYQKALLRAFEAYEILKGGEDSE
jgi:Na+-translocating ferredoxin:NAD+ oxidoreductase RnfG subunit